MEPVRPHLLIILDGFGIAEDPSVSAIDHARKPFIDELFARFPHSTLEASGRAVGLPRGQMGNSEVGHMNLGAGRVVYQDITRIDKDIEEGVFQENAVLTNVVRHCAHAGRKLHLLGLFSDGGVHSHLNHVYALLEMGAQGGLRRHQVVVHAFTDGRDTDPHGAADYVREFEERSREIGVGVIGSVIGRYHAMDRDNRWARTKLAYDLLVKGEGTRYASASDAVSAGYEAGVTDEFLEPSICGPDVGGTRVKDGDAIVFFNFRADRGRQLTRAFIQVDFDEFDRGKPLNLHYVTMTAYDSTFDVPVAFAKVDLKATLGEVIQQHGARQLRAAETEKYPHVTYFFSGGREVPYEGEDRILIPSPKVPTYDLQPEMSAVPLADAVAKALRRKVYDLAILNFANPDMVGHTGVFEAAVRAVETVDTCTKTVVEAALESGYSIEIIADHGNADKMRNPDGSPHTAHTTALVPHIIMADEFSGPIRHGKLGDIAPTILTLMGVKIPAEMTGDVLI